MPSFLKWHSGEIHPDHPWKTPAADSKTVDQIQIPRQPMYYGQVGWCGNLSPKIKKLWKDISHNFKEFRERLPCNTTHPLNEMDILLAHWVICTMSWGHEMCQLLNSFKLMGTDEHMGGQRGRPTNSELWKRECQLTLRLRSINILLLLKPAPWLQAGKPWFPVRETPSLYTHCLRSNPEHLSPIECKANMVFRAAFVF